MHLSPEILEAAYEYLRATPPFNRWKLPPGDEVSFRVLATRHLRGQHTAGTVDTVDVSGGRHAHTDSLIRTVAHEMVHIASKDERAEHGKKFQRLAARVCKEHGFDPKEF